MAEITLRKGLEVCYTQCQREYNEKRLSVWIAFSSCAPSGGIMYWGLCTYNAYFATLGSV